MIEDAGAQIGDDAAHVTHRALDQATHVPAFALHGFAHRLRGLGVALLLLPEQGRQDKLAETLAQPVDIHLERHQQTAQFVMHLAGNAHALVLTHRMGVRRELAQFAKCALQLLRTLRNAGFELLLRLV